MDEISDAPPWPDSMLRVYGDMLSVSDVSRVLNLVPRNVRNLLTSPDARIRLPGVKIGKSWRIAREQLRVYLLSHHNEDSALRSPSERHAIIATGHTVPELEAAAAVERAGTVTRGSQQLFATGDL